MYEHQPRQVDYGSADDGFLDEEAPDLGPLQKAAEAAELAEALSGLTDGCGGPLPAGDPLHPLACAIARALTEAGLTLHHCARHHPRHRLGGACLLPVAARHAPEGKAGVVVSWTTHDLLSLDWCRWPGYHGTQQVMNRVLGRVLGVLGFQVAPFGSGGAHIVTDGPRPPADNGM
ncbi:MAG TPA: hypothetical protein VEH31_03870 [Streptosporangiaceae bacterium]|nr:hypothetical protein [Streptosporangiaceae bacterium]